MQGAPIKIIVARPKHYARYRQKNQRHGKKYYAQSVNLLARRKIFVKVYVEIIMYKNRADKNYSADFVNCRRKKVTRQADKK